MPAFKGKLTDAQIKDSVDYFRTPCQVRREFSASKTKCKSKI